MSIHSRLEVEEMSETSLYELYSVFGERDTPTLYEEPFTLDTAHDWPTGAGNTVDRKIVGIDRTLYQQVMDGEFKNTNLEPQQIINAWVRHERFEISIVQGDNPVDTQQPAHKRALRAEHELVEFCGANVAAYEKVIWPALVACYARPIKKPHPGMWCAPLLDRLSTQEDEEIIARLQKLGVRDAFKRSKYGAHYGFGNYQCIDCRNYLGKSAIEECRVIDGMVRSDRHCDFWQDRSVAAMAKDESDEKLSHEAVTYGDGKNGEFCRTCKYSDHGSPPHCALVADPIAKGGWCRLWSAMNPAAGSR